ncbi:FAD-dependent oxidoreductase [Burkholderia cepacia]|uniref:FAD-dependent oxidoreductase n=1 Tax=Burkholderia cepacia TaxID=292 RepID=A0A8I1ASA6_BURCE|nr:FAD-dependent oxidoreductase [Burkholderia cepacia]MBH9681690.1 FAD-dependent oxidoreductase [Burkholderia cepacia]MBH9696141.1 FAD-dependent oxidoreductase [Burkholderia cepacia]MBH9712296.1 FAD-dependent oxidoreductase [Burkholderia cepacia]MBH9732829.1 FAD-dependent oxidoreductase [Burkholderia cepacia]
MKRLILAGGGHAHLAVLHHLAKCRPKGLSITLVTPSSFQHYSGMLPGWMAGVYPLEKIRIDLRPLCAAAGVELIESSVVGMDADRRCVALPDKRHLEYDLLSLDTGSETDGSWFEDVGQNLLAVKPLDDFVVAWPKWITSARSRERVHVAVIGGGAAGFELVMAAREALRGVNQIDMDLVAGDSGLLPGHGRAVRQRALRCLHQAGIAVHEQRAVGVPNGIMLADGRELRPDIVLLATGGRAPCWLKLSKLTLDEYGHIAVDAFHRTLSHSDVFASGDVCARTDVAMARSGVHAVHAGPILAQNLTAALLGERLHAYHPRATSLYLLACGERRAIASWGGFSAEGRWVWRWKDSIDRRFIARQLRLPPLAPA